MKNRLISIILVAIMVLTIIPAIAFANDENTALNLASKSAVLMDVSTGQVLYEKNSPFSLTKQTAYDKISTYFFFL